VRPPQQPAGGALAAQRQAAQCKSHEAIRVRKYFGWLAGVLAFVVPGAAFGCACGCGVFDVATSAMFPEHAGGMVFLEQDFMDQNQNWSGTSSAPAADNADKRIRTNFWTAGVQYSFNRAWTAELDVPYWDRLFVTQDDSGGIGSYHHSALGDVRLKGLYTGFSPDLSTGVSFGVKLPTGDSTYPYFDPDVQIGTGSTDLLLGAYHRGRLRADQRWSWFSSAQWDKPVAHKSSYRPGAEVDGVLGTYYEGWRFGSSLHLAPILQLVGTYRAHDGGSQGDPQNTGYTRGLLTPGLELDYGRMRLYADVARALYTNVSGNQLVARTLFKVSVSVQF
jgi:hypothetical protein